MNGQMVSFNYDPLGLYSAYSIPSLISNFRIYLNMKYGHTVWNHLRRNEIFLRLVDHYNFASSESVFNNIVRIVSDELHVNEDLLIQKFSFFLFNLTGFE